MAGVHVVRFWPREDRECPEHAHLASVSLPSRSTDILRGSFAARHLGGGARERAEHSLMGENEQAGEHGGTGGGESGGVLGRLPLGQGWAAWVLQKAEAARQDRQAREVLERSRELACSLGLGDDVCPSLVPLPLLTPRRGTGQPLPCSVRQDEERASSREAAGHAPRQSQGVPAPAEKASSEGGQVLGSEQVQLGTAAEAGPADGDGTPTSHLGRAVRPEAVLYAVGSTGLSPLAAAEAAQVVRAVRPQAVVLVLEPHEQHLLGLVHACSPQRAWGRPLPVAPEPAPAPFPPHTTLPPNTLLQGSSLAVGPGCPRGTPSSTSSSEPCGARSRGEGLSMPRTGGWAPSPLAAAGLEPGPVPAMAGSVVAFAAAHGVASPAIFHVWSAMHFLQELLGAHPLSHLAAAAAEAHAQGVPVLLVPSSLLLVEPPSPTSPPSEESSYSAASHHARSDLTRAVRPCSPCQDEGLATMPGPLPLLGLPLVAQLLGSSGAYAAACHEQAPEDGRIILARDIAKQYMALFEAQQPEGQERSGGCASRLEEGHRQLRGGQGASQQLQKGDAAEFVRPEGREAAERVLLQVLECESRSPQSALPLGRDFALAAAAYRGVAEAQRQALLRSMQAGWLEPGSTGGLLLGVLASWASQHLGSMQQRAPELAAAAKAAPASGNPVQGAEAEAQQRRMQVLAAGLQALLEGGFEEGGPQEGSNGGALVAIMGPSTLQHVGRGWCRSDYSPEVKETSLHALLSAAVPLPGPGPTSQSAVWLAAPAAAVQRTWTVPGLSQIFWKHLAAGLVGGNGDQDTWDFYWTKPRSKGSLEDHVAAEEGALVVASALGLVVALGSKAFSGLCGGVLAKLGAGKMLASARVGLGLARSWGMLSVLKATPGAAAIFSSGSPSAAAAAASASKIVALVPAKGGVVLTSSWGYKGGMASLLKWKGGAVLTSKSAAAVHTTSTASGAVSAGATASAGAATAPSAAALSAASPATSAAAAAALPKGSASAAAGGWLGQSIQHKVNQIVWRVMATVVDQRMRKACRGGSTELQGSLTSPTPWGLGLHPSARVARRGTLGHGLLAVGGAGTVVYCLWVAKHGASFQHPWMVSLSCALSALPSASGVAVMGRRLQEIRGAGAHA